jgi:hypothetical protein
MAMSAIFYFYCRSSSEILVGCCWTAWSYNLKVIYSYIWKVTELSDLQAYNSRTITPHLEKHITKDSQQHYGCNFNTYTRMRLKQKIMIFIIFKMSKFVYIITFVLGIFWGNLFIYFKGLWSWVSNLQWRKYCNKFHFLQEHILNTRFFLLLIIFITVIIQ